MFLRDCKSLYSIRADFKSARTGQQICTNGDGVPFACDVFAGLQIPIFDACGLHIRTNKVGLSFVCDVFAGLQIPILDACGLQIRTNGVGCLLVVMFLRDCKSLYSMRADCKSARTRQLIRTNGATNPHERGWESARTRLTDDAAGGVDCSIMMKQLQGHDAAIAWS